MFRSPLSASIVRCRTSTWMQTVNDFMRSPLYVILIGVMSALSSVFGLELVVYTAYILIGIFLCLFGLDLLPLMPIVICCYIAPSFANNPGRNENSIFYPQHGGIYLIILAAVFSICLLYRLITDAEIGGRRFLSQKRSMLPGMLVLGAAYMLSGIGMNNYFQYASGNLLFAFIQFVSVFLMYFVFSGSVKWDRVPRDYFAWIGLAVGFSVLAQLGQNYLSGRIFMEGVNTIDRELMATGWGMHNNIGGMMAMVLPFVFYLAMTRKHSWVYTLLATVLFFGTVASCSRTSMMIAGVEYLVCSVLLLLDKQKRRENLVVYSVTFIGVAVFAVISFDKLLEIFALFLSELDAISKRDLLFINGMKQYLQNPVFGGTFYPQEYIPWDWADLEAFSSFFPPRWHNTLVQIAASCGSVGLIAYGYHRFQTVKMMIKDFSREKLFIGLFVAALLGASLLDCHFFNVGPVLLYSMALAFAENINRSEL